MDDFQATGVIVLLFALRCIAPLVLTMGVGYLMNRMVDKWEREAEAQSDLEPEIERPVGVELPVLTMSKSPEKRPSPSLPCWLTRGCSPERRKNCPAYLQREKPCWAARLAIEGILPADCPDCPIYQHAHA
jgi:hypothetical protein